MWWFDKYNQGFRSPLVKDQAAASCRPRSLNAPGLVFDQRGVAYRW